MGVAIREVFHDVEEFLGGFHHVVEFLGEAGGCGLVPCCS